jgi:hypothetical protein
MEFFKLNDNFVGSNMTVQRYSFGRVQKAKESSVGCIGVCVFKHSPSSRAPSCARSVCCIEHHIPFSFRLKNNTAMMYQGQCNCNSKSNSATDPMAVY